MTLSLATPPPANVELEAAVIAAVVLDPPCLHEVAMILSAEDFFRSDYSEIFAAVLSLYAGGKPYDPLAVATELKRLGSFDKIGGDSGFSDILTGPGQNTVNATYYAQIVRQKSIARQLIDAGNELLRETYSDQLTADDLLASAQRRLFAIAEKQVRNSAKTGHDLAEVGWERLQQRKNETVSGVKSGYPALDMMTDGFKAANMIILAARPSQGKTAFGMNIAEHVSMVSGLGVLFLSLEMDHGELSDRLYAGQSRISASRLKRAKYLTEHDWAVLNVTRHKIADANLIVEDGSARTITQVTALGRYYKARSDIRLMIIDYLSLIDGQARRGESRQEEVARISRSLKSLARELEIPVLVLHQLNRESEKREDRRPRLVDLRESGQIEQDADLVLLLHRPDQYDPNDRPGEADILVAKNRCGQTGPVKLTFLKELTRFESSADRPAEQPDADTYF